MEIGVHQVGSPEDLAFEGVLAVCQTIDLELDPGDPPTPPGELAGRWFAPAPDRRMHVWLATIDGTAVGAAVSDQELDGVNDAVAELDAMTDPAWRQRGVATELVHAALPVLAADGVTSLLGWTPTEAGAAFCAALGMTHRSDDRCSRLRVADVDARQQQRWIDDGAVSGPGYRLEGWVGVVGDEWIEPLAEALAAMVDKPLDEVDWQPQALTPARVRERERSWGRMGYDTVTSLALAPDGTGWAAGSRRPTCAERESTSLRSRCSRPTTPSPTRTCWPSTSTWATARTASTAATRAGSRRRGRRWGRGRR